LYNLLLGIVNQFGNVAKRLVITTANDVLTGNQEKYVIRPGHDDEQSAEWRANIVKASASVPFVFSPTSMKSFGQDVLLMDGGTTWNNNMVAAV
jgi:predicted acylesterase/phospholipase RssA